MKTYSPYQERIRNSFAAAYNFLDKHKHARTEADWTSISDGLGQFANDPLTQDLIIAAVNELEREYRANKGSDYH